MSKTRRSPRSKVKKTEELKHKVWFACIGKVALAGKVIVTMFKLMNTVLIICRGRNANMADVEIYTDRQGQTGTDKDRQR